MSRYEWGGYTFPTWGTAIIVVIVAAFIGCIATLLYLVYRHRRYGGRFCTREGIVIHINQGEEDDMIVMQERIITYVPTQPPFREAELEEGEEVSERLLPSAFEYLQEDQMGRSSSSTSASVVRLGDAPVVAVADQDHTPYGSRNSEIHLLNPILIDHGVEGSLEDDATRTTTTTTTHFLSREELESLQQQEQQQHQHQHYEPAVISLNHVSPTVPSHPLMTQEVRLVPANLPFPGTVDPRIAGHINFRRVHAHEVAERARFMKEYNRMGYVPPPEYRGEETTVVVDMERVFLYAMMHCFPGSEAEGEVMMHSPRDEEIDIVSEEEGHASRAEDNEGGGGGGGMSDPAVVATRRERNRNLNNSNNDEFVINDERATFRSCGKDAIYFYYPRPSNAPPSYIVVEDSGLTNTTDDEEAGSKEDGCDDSEGFIWSETVIA